MRLRGECGAGIAHRFTCVLAGAWHYRVSWPVAHRAYAAHVEQALAAPPPAVCVLGIDWGSPRLRGRPGGGRSDGLLAQIDGRTSANVIEWPLAQPDPWRAGITHVTIDLSASYLRAVINALPNATVVADRFHLVQLANQMLTDVRQRATRDVRGRRGRKKDPQRPPCSGC